MAPDSFSFETKHKHDVVYLRFSQGRQLPVQQRSAADFKKTFWFEIDTVQTCTLAGGEYDCFHSWLIILKSDQTSFMTPAKNQRPSSCSKAVTSSARTNDEIIEKNDCR